MSKTTQVVKDGVRGKMTAEMWGRLVIRINGIVERVESGTLSFEKVLKQLQAVAEKKAEIIPHSPDTTKLEFWKGFYLEHFNAKLDVLNVEIPTKPTDGHWRLLVILKGLTNNRVYNACKKQFVCYKYADDLDTAVP